MLAAYGGSRSSGPAQKHRQSSKSSPVSAVTSRSWPLWKATAPTQSSVEPLREPADLGAGSTAGGTTCTRSDARW